MKRFQTILLFLAALMVFPCAAVAHAQAWSGIISSNRATDWTQVGAVPGSPGALPSDNWTQCGSTIAAYTGTAATINSALSSCAANHYVLLGAGTFSLSTSISIPSYVALRGSGTQSTFVLYTGSGGGCNGTGVIICMAGDATYPGGPTTTANWTAGFSKGTAQITLSSVSGITANQTMLVLNACDTGFSGSGCTTGASIDNGGYFVCSTLYDSSSGQGCGANGPDTGAWRANDFQQEFVMVTAINQGGCGPTCVTISDPLIHPNWAVLASPQAVLINPVIQAGVENMTIDGGVSNVQTGIGLQNAYECWVSGTVLTDFYEFGIYGLDVAHLTLQHNYLYKSTGHPDAYGFRTTVAEGDLIQNNIFQQWKNSFANDGPAVGEVIAYNYSVDQIVPSPSDQMWGSYWTHSAGDDFNLREGNMGDQAQDDNVHGTHLNQTGFRNFLWGFESCVNGASGGGEGSNCGGDTVKDQSSTAFVESSGVRYANNIANVLGTPNFTTTYISTTPFSAYAAWNIGGGNGSVSLPTDPLSKETMLLWGNWDNVTNATRWCGNSSDTGWVSLCGGTSEVPTSAPTYPNAVPTIGDTGAGQSALPASFVYSSRPSWWPSTIPWPAIGPDVSSGNVTQCTGTLNTTAQAGLPTASASLCGTGASSTAWGGHVNATPAMACAASMGILPDGTNTTIGTFNPNTCYASNSSVTTPAPPTNLSATVN